MEGEWALEVIIECSINHIARRYVTDNLNDIGMDSNIR